MRVISRYAKFVDCDNCKRKLEYFKKDIVGLWGTQYQSGFAEKQWVQKHYIVCKCKKFIPVSK